MVKLLVKFDFINTEYFIANILDNKMLIIFQVLVTAFKLYILAINNRI